MAFSLASIRDKIQTSLHGRRIGLTPESSANATYLAGPAGLVQPIVAATSDTTGTNLKPYGTVTLHSSAGDTYILDDPPYAGITMNFIVTSTGTNTITVTSTGSNFRTTSGSSWISADFNAQGEALQVVSLSTALWGVVSNVSAVVFTT